MNWPVCCVAEELVGLLVDAILEAGADGVRARRFGQSGGDRMVIDRPVLAGEPLLM